MYPEFIRQQLHEMEELRAKPDPSELDERGCFSKAACAAVDDLLLGVLKQRLNSFEAPKDLWRGTDPNNKWRTVSCMQKAIRFSDVEMAMHATSAAFDMDAVYAARRLGIIAIEDVGFGNMPMLALVLAALSSKKWREQVHERRLLAMLAHDLASGAKDRSAVNLLVIVDFTTSMNLSQMGTWSNDKLVEIIEDAGYQTDYRMAATWLLAGTKRYFGAHVPPENDRRPTRLFQLMVECGMPRLLLYVAAKVASRLNEGMFTSLLFMHRWMQETTDTSEVFTTKLAQMPTHRVGKLLGAAYDIHTREGRVAIKKWVKDTPAVGAWTKMAPEEKHDVLFGFGTFLVEGGVLQDRASYNNSLNLADGAQRVAMNYCGMPEEHHAAFLETLRTHITELNVCREKVLWAKFTG